MRMALFNAPTENADLAAELVSSVSLVTDPAPGSLDALLLFVSDQAELNRFAPEVLPLSRYDGLLLMAYPEKTTRRKSDITRDEGWDALWQAGLRAIRQVSLDDTWSVLRFRPADQVGR